MKRHTTVRISDAFRETFLEQVNAAYAKLRADAKHWQAVESERAAWDVTLTDGLAMSERMPYSAS